MNAIEYKKSVKNKMLQLIDSLLNQSTSPLNEIRELLKLRHELGLSNDMLFLPLVGIASETDQFPIGKVRENYTIEQLIKFDLALNEYLVQSENVIKSTSLNLKHKIQALIIV